ncbi:hypothetical protein GCM10018954_032380 [Kutzneria kofuensis]
MRPVHWQRDAVGQAVEGLAPVRQLGGLLAGQEVTLPEGVIRVLHRQRSPLWSSAVAPGRIGLRDVPPQWGDRPAVGGDVVHDEHEHVPVPGDPQQFGPQHRAGFEVEHRSHQFVHD